MQLNGDSCTENQNKWLRLQFNQIYHIYHKSEGSGMVARKLSMLKYHTLSKFYLPWK